MEQSNFNYSLKNIPFGNENTYFKSFINKMEKFISNMRWKALFFEQSQESDSSSDEDLPPKENYGFKTDKVPPRNKALDTFEADMVDLMNNINFKTNNRRNHFQNILQNDVKCIHKSDKVYVAADKTTNMYKMNKDQYKKLILENITSNYKKTDEDFMNEINKEANDIAIGLELENKVEGLAEKQAYITLKDHKKDFIDKPSCRLINPTKNELGAVSSIQLKKINKSLRYRLKLKQWRNTSDTLDWFHNIKNKETKKMLQLDIESYYPSISEELLDKAIKFASENVGMDIDFDDETIKIIKHCRKTILCYNNDIWLKKNNTSLFDVAMGAKDSAEICELVGLYILQLIKDKFPQLDIGLYRDDALGCYDASMPGHERSVLEKGIHEVFKSINLKIDLNLEKIQVNFLDITLNIEKNKFWPYRKPNSEIVYIHKYSNHPGNIKKELPKMVNKRLNELSCDKEEFEKVKTSYENALKNSGFKEKLEFKNNEKTKRNRKRKIIWFNPPFDINVSTNVGKQVLSLVKKHFPKNHKFHKIFNRNTIKVSYSCLPNMKSIISRHNHKILNEEQNKNNNNNECNCRNKENCPLKGNCLAEAIIYKATIKTDEEKFEYIGSTEKPFKTRYYNHTKSFNNVTYKNETKLSKCIWELKEENKNYNIEWNILHKSKPYKCGSRLCDICLSEKYQIMKHTKFKTNCILLNLRSEIMNKCRHANKFKIYNYK